MAEKNMPALPMADFSAWMSDGRDRAPDLLRPFPRAVNAFNWGPNKSGQDRAYWADKGYWQDPLFTSSQMHAYAQQYADQQRSADLEAMRMAAQFIAEIEGSYPVSAAKVLAALRARVEG